MMRPVLVTACQRGGNTWAARMLACGEGTRFLYQPFNGDAPRPVTNLRWPYLERKFTHVHPGNEHRFLRPTRHLLRPRVPLEWPLLEGFRIAKARSVAPTRRRFREELVPVIRARLHRQRPVIAAPGGVFLAEWLADRFGASVVCMQRHPAGIAAGYKRMQWCRHMGDVLDQDALMNDLLWEHRDALLAWNRRYENGERSWLGQAILWWKLVSSAFHRYRTRRPDFHFRRYEDLAMAPMAGFEDLYLRVGLDWSPGARARIAEHTGARAGEPLGRELHVLRRDSRAAAWSWRERLTAEEIEVVRRETAPWVERYGLDLSGAPDLPAG